MERIAADFRPLIKALELAMEDEGSCLREQLGQIELSLVSAQINPNPIAAVELRYALQVLREIDYKLIRHAQDTADLEAFFSTDSQKE